MTGQDALTFHRPPREYPSAVPSERLRIAPPPTQPPPPHTSLIQILFPVVGGVGLVGFAIVYRSSAFLFIAGAMIVLLLAFSIGMRWSQKRAVRKRAADDARRYAKYLRERDLELAEAGERQRGALARLYPEPGRLWTLLVKRANVWERRPDHRDFLHVRLGTGNVPLDRDVELDLGMNPLAEYQPQSLQEARKLVERRETLRGEPVVVDLAEVGVLAVTGDRARARAWSRTLMNQLAAWRAPHDLRLLTAFAPEDADEWEWGKWLPHQRVDPNVPGRFLFARSARELEALLEPEIGPRLEQLRRIAEADVRGRDVPLVAPELVVILDGYRPDHPANDLPAFRELLMQARRLKAVVVLLTDARELEPSHIDARLSVPERGPGSWALWGQDAPSIPEVFLDQVDLGTSEATARTLTPLRLAEGGDGERGLGASVRLVDLLGLPSADALDPGRTWRPRPRAAALRAPIGRAADGEVLELDLKQAAEGGMGPHGVLVGATGSGKSELLRSLVAGLAATHAPEQLAFVLVDYKGGAAFADLARLPHVAGLITNLQRDLSLVDRMHAALIGEQERRQTMLREAGNLDDIVAYQARRDADPAMPPMPDLLVIVDEFAELLAARPEFIELFVGLGRVGRSLGIHLLLSSQRLDEGRLRGLESHLRYRLCLRTYSATESKLVLGTPDAYLLPSLPGLGYLKVDTEKYVQFRAALASGPQVRTAVSVEPEQPVRVFDAHGQERAVTPETAPTAGPSELQVLVDRLASGRPPVHQVWVAPLPAVEPLDAVAHRPAVVARRRTRRGPAGGGRPARPPGRAAHPAVRARPLRLRRPPGRGRLAAHGQEHGPAHAGRLADLAAHAGAGPALRDRPRRRAAERARRRPARRRHRRQARPRGGDARRAPAADRGRGPRAGVPRGRPRVDERRPRRGRVRRPVPADRRLGGVQARVRGARPRARGAGRHRPQLRRARGGRRQPLGRDPAGAARQPRHAAGAAPARRDRLAGLAPGGVLASRRRARARADDRRAALPDRAAPRRRGHRGRGDGGGARCARRRRGRALERRAGAADPPPAARARPAAAAAAVAARGRAVRRRGTRARPRVGALRRARTRTSWCSATARAASRRCCAASVAAWSRRIRHSSCSWWWSTSGAR